VPDVEQLAAILRAETSDLDSYQRVLSSTIGDLLPAGLVEVDRQRSMSDRLASRPGTATAIRLHLADKTLELVTHRGRLVATIATDVRGVTISKKEVPVSEWVQGLATYLASMANESADAREALGRLLGT
jgi:class 3 adenylate cyclase